MRAGFHEISARVFMEAFYLTGLVAKVMVALSSVHPSCDCEAGQHACDQV
jgi:hypothetical protein